MAKMPPLGLSPKYLLQYRRIQEIGEAMLRYIADGKKIPTAWYEEIEEIVISFNKNAAD